MHRSGFSRSPYTWVSCCSCSILARLEVDNNHGWLGIKNGDLSWKSSLPQNVHMVLYCPAEKALFFYLFFYSDSWLTGFFFSFSGLHHFDGYRMAPPHNDTFDFLMTETTCSDVQSDMEDLNLDSVLQQLKSPSYEEPQHCLSDNGGISDTAEGFELLCDQSSPQVTVEDNISTSRVTSSSGLFSVMHIALH